MYNNFGCNYLTIIAAFKGAVENDFGGQVAIENEIELVESEIISKMSPKAMQMIQSVEYMEVPQISGFTYTSPFPILQDVGVWAMPRYNPRSLNQGSTSYTDPTCQNQGGCSGSKREMDPSWLSSDYTVSGDTIIFGSSFDQDNYTYYISYTIDTDRLTLNSVKAIIRDRVACTLGMQLYSRGDDTWKLVDMYCSRGDKSLEYIDENWLPAEFKRYKYYNTPFQIKGGMSTIKIGRA